MSGPGGKATEERDADVLTFQPAGSPVGSLDRDQDAPS